jgi:integral membrane protein
VLVTYGALIPYRVMAWVTGVLLLILTFVAVPMQIFGNDDRLVGIVGMAHGYLYMVYVVTALVLAYQARWRPGRTVLVLLAGTIPFASFVAERKVVAAARRERTTAEV